MDDLDVKLLEKKFYFEPNQHLSYHAIYLAEIKDYKWPVLCGPPGIGFSQYWSSPLWEKRAFSCHNFELK